MEDVTKTQNINAHYTNVAKVSIPKHVVVTGPESIPKHHIYSDKEANAKLAMLNNDIYVAIKNTPKSENNKIS